MAVVLLIACSGQHTNTPAGEQAGRATPPAGAETSVPAAVPARSVAPASGNRQPSPAVVTPAAAATTASPTRTLPLPDTSDGVHAAAIFLRCYREFGAADNSSPSCAQSANTSVETVANAFDIGWLWAAAPIDKFAAPELAAKLGIAVQFDRMLAYFYDYTDFTPESWRNGWVPRTVAWWKSNHPDWIEYGCDKNSIPWEFGDAPADTTSAPAAMPWDIANPAARDFYWTTFIKPALDNGAPLISIDNTTLYNEWARCGHYDASGRWIAQYSGDYSDSRFTQDALDWAAYLYGKIKSYAPQTIVVYNYDPAPSDDDPQVYTKFLQYADVIYNEAGFNNWGGRRYTDELWQKEARFIQICQQLGKGTIHHEGVYITDPAAMSADEKNWAIGNYLLFKGNADYLSLTASIYDYDQSGWVGDYGAFYDYPEYRIPIGHPLGPMRNSNGVYLRSYSGGLVIVNPSSTKDVTVQVGGQYQEMDGETVGPSITVSHASAAVLLNR